MALNTKEKLRLVCAILEQKRGEFHTCPRCGGGMESKLTHNALSRRADIYICPKCGLAEAFEDFQAEAGDAEARKSLSEWAVVQKEKMPEASELPGHPAKRYKDIIAQHQNKSKEIQP